MQNKEGLAMRRFAMTLAMLGVVLLLPLILTSCDGDNPEAPGTFVLGECRLDAAECRLQ
jgi:hypothetical protein